MQANHKHTVDRVAHIIRCEYNLLGYIAFRIIELVRYPDL